MKQLVANCLLMHKPILNSPLTAMLMFGLGLVLSAAAVVEQGMPQIQPNIVFILVDDMGWADGGSFGSKYYQTPNIDRLAAEGMRFTQAYASCAVCSPTRAAIQTGKSPARLHITDWIAGEGAPKNSRLIIPDWQKQLPLEEITVAEALKQLGYVTGHIGKWHLGGSNFYPEHQGFDVNIAGGHTGHPASYWWPYGASNATHRVPDLAKRGGRDGEYLTDRLTDEAIEFITANRDRRFYLQLAHYAVHTPLMGKEDLAAEFKFRPGANGQSNAVYAAMLKSLDDSVGRILKQLEELHLAERTVVIFTSDNGGLVTSQPPATSNAPLPVKAPWLTRSGAVCATPVISTDFFPTLVELAGADASVARTAQDGVSLVPLLKGSSGWRRDSLFWHYPHYWNVGKVSPYSVVRIGDWKLIRFYETGREELYDVHDDVGEAHDLALVSDFHTKRTELSARLDAWLKDVGAQMPAPRVARPNQN